jgi:hypothetical protein
MTVYGMLYFTLAVREPATNFKEKKRLLMNIE